MYPQPSGYGSIGALWAQGIGFVHPPLSVGKHTIDLHSELLFPGMNLGVKYNNTWTITVKP